MATKFSKADVYRTNNIVVSLCNSEYAQDIVKCFDRIGEYEGQNYWNCFDIYDIDGIRFLVGNGAPYYQTNKYNRELLKQTSKEIRNINSWTENNIQKQKELVYKFCDSIKKGIHDPSVINSFQSYKKNLCEQIDFFPDKPLLKVASELTNYINIKNETEIKQKINDGINKVISTLDKNILQQPYDIQLDAALKKIYTNEKTRQQNKNTKEREKHGRND